ncbi:flagellar motor switch protein FliG [Aurantiacibacter poecillastricola]|uniref:flagellar motor switch protein FliG n=1 Tax=Aurantiacibacter poecillastricola TaxID=3064385 RepID=UPI00273E2E8E|nr:FliG C-terminal domain-containing protein [Aurantiacibacter sp. 219JJ12-13]MDP5263126.1 FliG C-terminal domain-containing protein [Aurantiacibacter sp. 219JJ12-13]
MTALDTAGNAERAAVILTLMDDDEAARLLALLEPAELQLVGEKMIALGDIDPEHIAKAIEGFVQLADDATLSGHDRPSQLRQRMTQALGEVKADSIMQRIVPGGPAPSLELARWLAPPVLLALVEGEHPQAIAVLLLLLDAEPAAELLSLLPASLQPDLVERIARMRNVSGLALDLLEEVLARRITTRFGKSALIMGGAREAAELINMAARPVSGIVMPAITQKDAALARAIEAEMFTFEMLFELDPMGMGRLLREVENEMLVDALKGVAEDDREPFFAAMSSRAADGVRDEIEERGRLKRSDVIAAQNSIVKIARKLADDGEISLGADDGEFV